MYREKPKFKTIPRDNASKARNENELAFARYLEAKKYTVSSFSSDEQNVYAELHFLERRPEPSDFTEVMPGFRSRLVRMAVSDLH